MPGKLHNRHSSSRCNLSFPILAPVFVVSILFICYVFFPSAGPSVTYSVHTARAERSFVASLEHFLTHKAPKLSLPVTDDTVRGESDHLSRELDDLVFEREIRLLNDDPVGFPVKVYVYEMPRKFTYDLLWLFHNTYKETWNLTSNGSPVHRLIEQHSIDYWLWADLIAPESERRLKSVVRVHQQQDADIFFVPFFTTISFFLLEKQQCKALYREALKWITDQPAWKRSEGRDHIFPIHHPWSFKSVRKYVKNAIWLLPDLDSTGNWYKPGQVSLEKDLILPYVPNVDLCDAKCLSENSSKRTTLLFFRGRLKRNAGGRVRAKLGAELSSAKDVIITEGTAGDEGKLAAQKGMRRSLFCLCPAGDTPSSARLFDAIVSGCIPVVVSDELELPFEGLLDYRKIAVIVSSGDATQPGWLVNHLRSLSPSHIKGLQKNLAQYSRHFLYSSPAQALGPEDLTWRMEAASTSLLSKRWGNLFALVPNLDIDDSVFLHPEEGKRERDGVVQSFMDFVDRVLALQGDSPIKKFSLKRREGVDSDRVNSWICKVLQRGVSELDLSIDFPGYYYYNLPQEMFVSSTLVKLRLASGFDVHWWAGCEDTSLPVLKSLCIHSERIFFEDEIEALLPCFPVLEELQIANMERMGLDVTVSSATLTKLAFAVVGTKTYRNPKSICFDTPNLLSLAYSDLFAEDYPLVNMEKLVEASLVLRANDDQIKRVRAPKNGSLENDVVLQFGNVVKLMNGVQNVQKLHLCPDTLEVLSLCCESMPVFNNLKTLGIYSEEGRGWQAMPVLLRNCPHLQTLVIEGLVHHITDKCGDACDCIYRKDKGRSLTSCPVKVLVIKGFTGTMKEMNMVEHFLDYFPCLKEVKLYIEEDVPIELISEAGRILEMIEEYNSSYSCNVGLLMSKGLVKKWTGQ